MSINAYISNFKTLTFIEKHTVAGVWVNAILVFAGLLLSAVIFHVSTSIQNQANNLQRQTFIREQNELNKKRIQDTVSAFNLDLSLSTSCSKK